MSSKVFSPISVTLSFHPSLLSPCLPFMGSLVVPLFISLELNNWYSNAAPHTLTHTYRYSQFELAAGGTNCLSVGTLLLLFIHIFTLFSLQLLSLSSHFTCPELFFFPILSPPPHYLFPSLSCPYFFSPLSLSSCLRPSRVQPGLATHTHLTPGWCSGDADSVSFIFNERLWLNWTLLSLTAGQQELK